MGKTASNKPVEVFDFKNGKLLTNVEKNGKFLLAVSSRRNVRRWICTVELYDIVQDSKEIILVESLHALTEAELIFEHRNLVKRYLSILQDAH